MAMTNEEAKKVIADVMRKAAMDEDFRKLALEEPKKAIAEVAPGKELPEGYTLSFVEGDPDADQTVALPPLKTDLSEEDLDKVAGGGGGVCPVLYTNWG